MKFPKFRIRLKSLGPLRHRRHRFLQSCRLIRIRSLNIRNAIEWKLSKMFLWNYLSTSINNRFRYFLSEML
jgi:hypothetical protein